MGTDGKKTSRKGRAIGPESNSEAAVPKPQLRGFTQSLVHSLYSTAGKVVGKAGKNKHTAGSLVHELLLTGKATSQIADLWKEDRMASEAYARTALKHVSHDLRRKDEAKKRGGKNNIASIDGQGIIAQGPETDSPLEAAETAELAERVRRVCEQTLAGMEPIYQQIAHARFGEHRTQEQIATDLGISPHEVRRKEKVIIAKLRAALADAGLKPGA